jgi:DNA primase
LVLGTGSTGSWDSSAEAAQTRTASAPRDLNTATAGIYNKSSILFGPGEAADGGDKTVVLTEGPLDAIGVELANPSRMTSRLTPLALGGTAITTAHAKAIHQLNPAKVTLAFDDDGAGERALMSAYRLLHL